MATVTEKDVLVVARIVNFLKDGPKGNVEIVVVTDGPAAEADAASFVSLVGSGKQVGDITLSARIVKPEDLLSANAKIIIIPDGMDTTQFDTIFAAARKKRLVTIAFSDACLVAKRCAIAVKTDPAVDIEFSVSAAQATDVSFDPTLRMMIKELP